MYDWLADWTHLPQQPLGWMHSGIAIDRGHVVIAHPAAPALLFLDESGTIRRTVALDGLLEPHGFCVSRDGLWIADVGFKRRVDGSQFHTERRAGRVVCVDDDGRIARQLLDPGEGWSPTSIALARESDLWVADGYGRHLVHRFNARGQLVQTLTGEEGAGRFSCPDGVLIDRRRSEPELYVSDRANARLQVYDLKGRFRRVAGVEIVATPTDMVVVGRDLALTDFTHARDYSRRVRSPD